MKILFYYILLLGIMLTHSLYSQGTNGINYLDYFAADNSMDGQPLIETENHLRFFPVFALRDSTARVTMRIYRNMDGEPVYRDMSRSSNGLYWEALLPPFQLGQAIHRIEVEVHVPLDSTYKFRLHQFDSMVQHIHKIDSANKLSSEETLRLLWGSSQEGLSVNSQSLRFVVACCPKSDIRDRDTSSSSSPLPYINEWNSLSASAKSNMIELVKNQRQVEISQEEMELEQARESYKDSIRRIVKLEAFSSIADKSRTGPSIESFDVVLTDDLDSARILYRNYRLQLRRMPALDPAEKLGIFRARYVPFAVVGGKLRSPVSAVGEESAIFEIGLGFGDVTMASDQLMNPEFSARRLGVAFVVSEQFFSDEASIRALALTYDFNAYGSIGVGANFPGQGGMESYFSFGINKKAFEAVFKALASKLNQ